MAERQQHGFNFEQYVKEKYQVVLNDEYTNKWDGLLNEIPVSIKLEQYGFDVEYTFSGDKHHLDSNDPYGIENVLVRSLCGTDNYANNKRLYSKAGQTLCIFNQEDGKVCTYNIAF